MSMYPQLTAEDYKWLPAQKIKQRITTTPVLGATNSGASSFLSLQEYNKTEVRTTSISDGARHRPTAAVLEEEEVEEVSISEMLCQMDVQDEINNHKLSPKSSPRYQPPKDDVTQPSPPVEQKPVLFPGYGILAAVSRTAPKSIEPKSKPTRVRSAEDIREQMQKEDVAPPRLAFSPPRFRLPRMGAAPPPPTTGHLYPVLDNVLCQGDLPKIVPRPPPKTFHVGGNIVKKGDVGYDMVDAILLGLEKTLSKADTFTSDDIKHRSFFNTESGRPHEFAAYHIKIFTQLRNLFGVSTDHMKSPGKSGSFFYLTMNRQYYIKTISHNEVLFFLEILSSYTESIISRFHGLYRLRCSENNLQVYFVLMENVFIPQLPVSECYDLKIHTKKGSTSGRFTRVEEKSKGNVVLKDLDVGSGRFKMHYAKHQSLMDQISKDTYFLQVHNIMDYSLLVGVHSIDHTHFDYKSLEWLSQPSRFFQSDLGGILNTDGDEVLFIGIIDIFTPYNWKKRAETSIKGLMDDVDKISAVNPQIYRNRFRLFMQHTIVPTGRR
ncbi:hypothetical protein PROFUN_08852 [Planoprotostelium fungivorum]|uniref:PIPK domain-containing protein n=1 Tax=Planoprotostelium fungivorum TaxID=1890364 RepID=A0A2P6NIY1_9EUKA|nr:hypothetical protein PROFUN_08852 [Planoprotostelium fungivorum]